MITNEWLKTSDPVVPVGSSMTSDVLFAIRKALTEGVTGVPDLKRSGFYDIEIADRWYYVHIPRHIARVYLVATRQLKRFGDREDIPQSNFLSVPNYAVR